MTKQNSFATFLKTVPRRIAAVKDRDVIFFVGDSTVFGFGVKEPEYHSFPAQLEVLLHKKNPDTVCLNLARIHTGVEEHLRVLALLPPGARVIYRGGLTYIRRFDRQGDGFFFTAAGHIFESRLLKMLFLLFPSLLPRNPDKAQKIRDDFNSIMHRLNLEIITMDYTTYPESAAPPFFFLEKDKLPNIPLRKNFTKAGFMKEDGTFQDRFVSISGTHPNELGHYLESVAIYNYLCDNSRFGLSPDDQLDNPQPLQLLESLTGKYNSLKKKLQQLTEHTLFNYQRRMQWKELVYELWFYAGLLLNIRDDNNETLNLEYNMARKLGVLVFHDARMGWILLTGGKAPLSSQREIFERWFSLSGNDKEIYEDVLWAITKPDSVHYQYLEIMAFGGPVVKEKKQISYLGDIYPFPLELCPRFVKESEIGVEKLRTEKAWEYFFTIPYNYFQSFKIQSCNITDS